MKKKKRRLLECLPNHLLWVWVVSPPNNRFQKYHQKCFWVSLANYSNSFSIFFFTFFKNNILIFLHILYHINIFYHYSNKKIHYKIFFFSLFYKTFTNFISYQSLFTAQHTNILQLNYLPNKPIFYFCCLIITILVIHFKWTVWTVKNIYIYILYCIKYCMEVLSNCFYCIKYDQVMWEREVGPSHAQIAKHVFKGQRCSPLFEIDSII